MVIKATNYINGNKDNSAQSLNSAFPSSLLQQTKKLYPHVYEAIELLWGYPELQSYLKKLIVNERAIVRGGFPTSVTSEITRLYVAEDDSDAWSQTHLR